MSQANLTAKIWNLAGVHRDDGVSYGDYLEQITCLLFLKLAHEINQPLYNKDLDVFWLKGLSLTDLDSLPEPEVLAQEILENLESGLQAFREIAQGLEMKGV